jgi:hypothetical protein
LFLFHLLEFDTNVNLQLDLDAFNKDVLEKGALGVSSQMILKHTDEMLKVITSAPASGVYVLQEDGSLTLKKASVNRREALGVNEAFVLRIQEADEYAYQGGDMGILFLNSLIRDARGQLNANGSKWVQALQNLFALRNLSQEERAAIELAHNPANVKSGRDM